MFYCRLFLNHFVTWLCPCLRDPLLGCAEEAQLLVLPFICVQNMGPVEFVAKSLFKSPPDSNWLAFVERMICF